MNLTARILCGIATCLMLCLNGVGQTASVSAQFNNFYGATRQTQTVYVNERSAGNFVIASGQTYSTPVGTVTAPGAWNNTAGQATLVIPFQFTPNGVDGAFSGSFTALYTNTKTSPASTLSLTINFSGDSMVPKATAGLKYQVLSILYTPPGNASNSGYSNTVSAGSTTSYALNFSDTDTITFSAGFFGANNSVDFTTGVSAGSGDSYTTSYQASGGAQLSSVTQKIDHTQDQVFLLIDPSIVVTQTGTSAGYFDVGPSLDATGNFGTSGAPPDILNINIAGLKNPTQIPLSILQPQVVKSGTTLPGLSFICAKPLPAAQCTQQNACGCTAADFAPIVAQDELANDSVDTTTPNSVDAERFVYVDYLALQGPDQQGAGPVKTSYSVSDSDMSGETTSNGTSYAVGFSHSFGTTGLFKLDIKDSDTFTASQTQTAGTQNGTAHTGTLTLGTSDVGCFEYVDIYEDTTYHTFAYALSEPAPVDCQ